MIQRLQSIFLFLGALCFGASYTLPFATSSQQVSGIFEDQQYKINDHIALLILAALGFFIGLMAIFLYNNRKLQLKLAYLGATLAIILPVVAVLIYTNHTANLQNVNVEDGMGLYLPIPILAFFLLSARYINKDENLVRSMDRLR